MVKNKGKTYTIEEVKKILSIGPVEIKFIRPAEEPEQQAKAEQDVQDEIFAEMSKYREDRQARIHNIKSIVVADGEASFKDSMDLLEACKDVGQGDMYVFTLLNNVVHELEMENSARLEDLKKVPIHLLQNLINGYS